MIAARIVTEMDDGIGDDRVATVVPEVPVPEAVPAVPDEIIRLIMQFKHANFKRRFAAEDLGRRMQMLARKEAERIKHEEVAICERYPLVSCSLSPVLSFSYCSSSTD